MENSKLVFWGLYLLNAVHAYCLENIRVRAEVYLIGKIGIYLSVIISNLANLYFIVYSEWENSNKIY